MLVDMLVWVYKDVIRVFDFVGMGLIVDVINIGLMWFNYMGF